MFQRKNIFLIISILILGFLIVLLLRNLPRANHTPSSPSGLITKKERITDASASIKYKIDVSYPQFSGLPNVKTEETVNTLIKQKMQADITTFTNEVNTTEQQINQLPPPLQAAINELYITYTVARADDDIVSISFAIMNYQAGMDHPNNYTEVFNYAIQQKKELSLKDIFLPNTPYLDTLSKISRGTLTERFKDNPYSSDFITNGTAPDEKNYLLFTLSRGNLNLIFNPYQVAPYYAGTQIVKIPTTALLQILAPSYQ